MEYQHLQHLARVAAMVVTLGGVGSKDAVATVQWDMEALSAAPQVWYDPNRSVAGIEAIFYEGMPWQGEPTRVFAYYGLPDVTAGQTVPAMVLVHGGGGSAFIPWVKLWVERGYAAIAMDTCGCISSGGYRNHPRHAHGGPPGWGGFDQLDWPVTDQWTYHAVADTILAHSLILALPEVDAQRTGITGISWGGYLTCIVAGVDSRFRFAAPVYGCGFLGDNSTWLGRFAKLGPEKAERWLAQWDPSQYLPDVEMPMLWVTGTNDFAYPMDSLQKSYRLPSSPRTLCLRVRMPHAHGGPGENPEELHAMANAILMDGPPLARITSTGRHNRQVWATFTSETPIVRAELNYTTDAGRWQDRNWKTIGARLDVETGRATAMLPQEVTAYYFNLIDDRNLVVSSEHEQWTQQCLRRGEWSICVRAQNGYENTQSGLPAAVKWSDNGRRWRGVRVPGSLEELRKRTLGDEAFATLFLLAVNTDGTACLTGHRPQR